MLVRQVLGAIAIDASTNQGWKDIFCVSYVLKQLSDARVEA